MCFDRERAAVDVKPSLSTTCNIKCYFVSLITGFKTGFHQNMLKIGVKTKIQGVSSAHVQHSEASRKVWSLLFLVSVCGIWKVNSVWSVETTSLIYYILSSSDLGHINILLNSLIIISITAPPQINITSLINADMCDLLQWVMEECLYLIFLQLILLPFLKWFLIRVTYSGRMGSGGCFDTFGNLVLSGNCTSRGGGGRRPDEINAGCWLLQFHGNPHCHPECLCTDWDICKLSSPINACQIRCPLPVTLSRPGCDSRTSTVAESIKSQCCSDDGGWWARESPHLAQPPPASSSDILQSLNSISGSNPPNLWDTMGFGWSQALSVRGAVDFCLTPHVHCW